MGVVFAFLLALLPSVLIIGALVVMPRWMKVVFAAYAFLAIRHFLEVGLATTTEEAMASLNFILTGVALLAFGGILGSLDGHDRKGFIYFVLKYGSAYMVVFTVPKLFLYWQGATWSEASLMVALLPYKWVIFLILIVLIKWLSGVVRWPRNVGQV